MLAEGLGGKELAVVASARERGRVRPREPEGSTDTSADEGKQRCTFSTATRLMTFTEAAAQVLRLVGKPLHYKEITDVAIEKDLLSHVGKSPDVTMGARLAALVKKGDKDNPLVRIKPGVFALRDWDQATIDKGLADRTPAIKRLEALVAKGEVQVVPVVKEEPSAAKSEPSAAEASSPSQPLVALDDEEFVEDTELRARAELAAGANQFFAAEEDDDEPILGAEDEDEGEAVDRGDESGGRRRRRRRRRRPGDGPGAGGGGDDLPTYTVSDAPIVGRAAVPEDEPDDFPAARAAVAPRPGNGSATGSANGEDLVGLAFADALAGVLSSFERGGGIAMRQLGEAARRRLRLPIDAAQVPGAALAAMRADNARRGARGERPRFRLGNGRVGLTEWSLDGDTRRLERELQASLTRLRDASRKNLARKLGDLPARAFSELMVVLLEAAGLTEISPVRLKGSAPGESHFAGRLRSAATDLPLAVVVRREGRDVGRERVNELRGNLHHYGSAAAGWILTTGQVLSGARDESSLPGAAPVRLVDGIELARLCEEHGVGVTPVRIDLSLPDVELFESLRSG
jgi:hypothetical protein